MSTTTDPNFPSLRQYVDAGCQHPAVPDHFAEWLGEVLIQEPGCLRRDPIDMLATDVRIFSEVTDHDGVPRPIHCYQRDGWVLELLVGEVTVEEVVAALPAQVVDHARGFVVAEHRPWVLEVEDRESWICTATGIEGSGPVAVVRPRVEPSFGGDYSGEAVLSLDALRMAVEVLEDRLGDDLGN